MTESKYYPTSTPVTPLIIIMTISFDDVEYYSSHEKIANTLDDGIVLC